MTKKEVRNIIDMGSSHAAYIPGLPTGVTAFQAFLALQYLIKGKLYWFALRNAYEKSDNLFVYRADVKKAFSSVEENRHELMTHKEMKYLESLPAEFYVYRGMTEKELKSKDFGVSWTLNRSVAKFFANEYQRNYSTNDLKKTVHKKLVKKGWVVAYFNAREEDELIVIRFDNY